MSNDSSAKSPSTAAATPADGTTGVAAASEAPRTRPRFQISPVPPNPLGEGRCIRTAAALIIGDEILNGKTRDSNSNVFAQYCFEHGIDLKRIEVIPDDENEIIEAARRLTSKYDFVVTSGGIGPTHDDITYESIAKAFNTKVVHHQETINRMHIMNQYRNWALTQTEEQKAAQHRMALFPETAEVIYVDPEIWVPVVRLEGKLCILPGIPGLFQKMLHALTGFLPLPPKQERPLRIQIFTERPESMIAPYLTQLQERLKPHGIQVGSYPVLYKGVFVSLIGRDLATSPSASPPSPANALPGTQPSEPRPSSPGRKARMKTRVWLAEIAREVEKEVGGRVLSEEEVAQQKEASRTAMENKRTGQVELQATATKSEANAQVKAKY
ncbi:hypothetical protein CC1G_06932 [Coprinopsis cinerea okayama7|uniref:MoaB/Mog domain-containing protein n=1 Tax=Coprinopsis cinerea (strain Okayama-7 / 130 / ATCC MYA-4618 / FGSC 9003) TaxID=240176 RepID=A8NZQ8_COPC7|nr:hypothetical protein CC1G_06932 [Coprinopsis cinerea okayama7\|eukprot:XP_001837726.1 hypothetical protein CC1G_06932 [Coprinopsis cinerea okayama7\